MLACPVLSVDWPLTTHLTTQNMVFKESLSCLPILWKGQEGLPNLQVLCCKGGLLLMSCLLLLQVLKGWQLWRTFSALPKG